VIMIKLSSLPDLVRLAVALSIPQMTSYIIKYKHEGKTYLGILGVFRDFYKLYGLPIFYYYVADGEEAAKIDSANYIIISSDGDKIEFGKTPKPGMSIPLISLAEKPPFIPD